MDQPPVAPPMMDTGRPGPANDTSKLLAAAGYIVWIVALVAILIDPYKDEKFVRFHAIQALVFGVGLTVLSAVLAAIPFVGWVLDVILPVAWVVLAIMWAIKAYNGEYAEMPIVFGVAKTYIDR
jgi:uncharacterized membrane protein